MALALVAAYRATGADDAAPAGLFRLFQSTGTGIH